MKTTYKNSNGILYNLYLYYKQNYIENIVYHIIIYLLSFIEKSNLFKILITSFYIQFNNYFIHVLYHKYIPNYLSLHTLHHISKYSKERWIHWCADIVECLTDTFMGLVGLLFNLILKKWFGTFIFDNTIILFYSFFYTTIHMFTYHTFKIKSHMIHHATYNKPTICNYGPEVMDIIFKTKKDNTEFETIDSVAINAIIVGVLVTFLKKITMQ
jgi:hypothetical protein